jgi:hypothetical protein
MFMKLTRPGHVGNVYSCIAQNTPRNEATSTGYYLLFTDY